MTIAQETPMDAARRLAAGAPRNGFKFEALHTYTDRDANPLYWRIRAKHPVTGKKWIRPMKLTGNGHELGEPVKPANGKPLYRLHELASRPDDVVILTEGELKADQLAALGLLVTRSGAADSAGKADWQALAGRDVLIWRDNDKSGRHYADAVLAALRPLGCKVKVIDVELLGLAPKGDAVDWLASHPEATAADVLTLACAKLALTGVAKVDTDDAEEARFRKWFGNPTPERVAEVTRGLLKMRDTFKLSKVTIVNREDIHVHMVNGRDPFGDMVPTSVSGSGVYGYVWGGEHTGSGYRVIMGKWFLADPDPIEGAAQTIYHELTHKVLRTTDHGHGKIKSRGFATAQPAKALENADNGAFYAVSFVKAI